MHSDGGRQRGQEVPQDDLQRSHPAPPRNRQIHPEDAQREAARQECALPRFRPRHAGGSPLQWRRSQNHPHAQAQDHLQRGARSGGRGNDLADDAVQAGRGDPQATAQLDVCAGSGGGGGAIPRLLLGTEPAEDATI
uniref:(northern house mosquito) hypothetical protein n=1 Tax=Culex pipiens TaxID=7175 RepID=A0A8D8FII7_CULPI